jgi:MSHA pilin protein MshD
MLQRGISLVELIMFIVIISVALTGILLVMNIVTRSSADPLIHKQALAIAESLLEEVELMPFTYCEPDDASAVTASSAVVGAGGCNSTIEGPGPESIAGVVEDRYGTAAPAVNAAFDNVSDYGGAIWGASGFTMNAGNGGIKDITNSLISGLSGYSANITVAQAALGVVPASESLHITVTVTGPDGLPIVLDGYRTRYAPRSVP